MAVACSAAAQQAAFRVRLGVNDSAPRVWDGSVTVTGGTLAYLREWRPRMGDRMTGARSWTMATRRGENDPTRVAQRSAFAPQPKPYLLVPGLFAGLTGPAPSALFRTPAGTFTVHPGALRLGKPLAMLGGSVSVDAVPFAERLSSGPETQDEFPALAAGEGSREIWAAWLAWRDDASEIVVRRHDGRAWGPPVKPLSAPGDIHTVRLARGAGGAVWVVWSQQTDGNWDLFARRWSSGEWGPLERLTTDAQPDIFPQTATDAGGRPWVVWQGFRNGQADVFARRRDASGWTPEERLSPSGANDWEPSIAADRQGKVYVAWDTYDRGDYDVVLRAFAGGVWQQPVSVTATPKYEANVTLTCDARNRLWLAWNESGFNWGKDTAYHQKPEGTPLHQWARAVVNVFDGGRFLEPEADVNEVRPEGHATYHDFPVIHADRAGRVWLWFRHRTVPILDTPTQNPTDFAVWESYAVWLDGAAWSEPVPMPFSAGRGDMRASLANDAGGGLWAAWSTDNRDFTGGREPDADVWAARMPAPAGPPVEPALRPVAQFTQKESKIHLNEPADVQRIRAHRIEAGGRTYRLFRGDTHRHTEMSFDGGSDGTLLQAYRYALDAAALDYLAVTEHCGVHNNVETVRCGAGGAGTRYYEYLVQQSVDLFTLPGSFTPIYAYERSVSAPNGHRNVLLPTRGHAYLPIPNEEHRGQTDATALFNYLRPKRGIAIPHTVGGTDWRSHDPDVQPLVEIYQGFRSSYEYEGAPRSGHRVNPLTGPGDRQGRGYVWEAWAKGYRIGVQASSDHHSTHTSYAVTIAPEGSRTGLIEAMRRRHNYAATDNIVVDYRVRANGRDYLQGEEVEARDGFRLVVNIVGTAPLRQIDVIRDQEFVLTRQHLPSETAFTYEDRSWTAGVHFYYVRVQQVDGQIAWSSPVWITR